MTKKSWVQKNKTTSSYQTSPEVAAGWVCGTLDITYTCYIDENGYLYGCHVTDWSCNSLHYEQGDGGGGGGPPTGGSGGNSSDPCGPNAQGNVAARCVVNDPCKTSVEEVKQALANVDTENLKIVIKYSNKFGKMFGIDTKVELQHFLAQSAYETTDPGTGVRFGTFEESLWYSRENIINNFPSLDPDVYAENPRKMAEYLYGFDEDLGNTQPGDGWRFRGSGALGLTGRYNFTQFTEWYQTHFHSNLDFTENPNLLRTPGKLAVISGLWYWDWRVSEVVDENTSVTEAVNGGNKGKDIRKELLEKLKQFITDCLA